MGGAVTGPAATFQPQRQKRKKKKPTDASTTGARVTFLGFHSQHSGARRAHEAAHGDVGVRHPGLVALEAVFVYSGLGQLADLAGADLLVVPVLSVRHLERPPRPLLRRCRPVAVSRAADSSRAAPRRYMEHLTPRIMQTRRCGFRCLSTATAFDCRGGEARQVSRWRGGAGGGGSGAAFLQSKSAGQVAPVVCGCQVEAACFFKRYAPK